MIASYDVIGQNYSAYRRPDRRIAGAIVNALGAARTVLNVGAGTGSYEPQDATVIAVEPSRTMISQRDPAGFVVQGLAEHLPIADKSVDASVAILTMHHWEDHGAGLREMKRVSRGRVVVLTWNPKHEGFWLVRDYFPEILEYDRSIFPVVDEFADIFDRVSVSPIPVPRDCTDGFLGAYWGRPERYLEEGVRGAISSFSRIHGVEQRLERLRNDLSTGEWTRRNTELAARDELDVGYQIIVAE